MGNYQISLRILFTALLFFIFSSSSYAQFYTLKKTPLSFPSFDFKFIHAVQDDNMFTSKYTQAVYSGVYDLDFNIPVSKSINLNFVLPVSVFKYTDVDGDTDIGNIGIGIQTKKQISEIRKLNFTLTLFLPTSPTEFATANFSSIFVNYYDIQKYMPNSVGLYFNSENRWDFSDGHILKVDAGTQFLIPTAKNGEMELLLHYGVGGGAAIGDFTALLEFSGIAILTANIDSFSDRLFNTFSFGLNYRGFSVKPGVFYKIYFNEMIPFNSAFGFNIQFDFP
jgi:hypothetical protein